MRVILEGWKTNEKFGRDVIELTFGLDIPSTNGSKFIVDISGKDILIIDNNKPYEFDEFIKLYKTLLENEKQ